MAHPIPYHCGSNNEFSLSYVSPDRDKFLNHLDQYTSPTTVITATAPLSTPVHLAYSSTPVEDTTVEIPDHPFVQALLCVFAGVVDGRRQRGETVRGNKTAQLEEIPSILSSRVQWKQPVPRVGGQLLSNLILSHPLPNANHRTSLGMLVVYLRSVGVDIAGDDIVASDVEEYISDSKRILTVRRNVTKFRILEQCGCTTIERKGGIRIPLDDFDLTCSNPYSEFAQKHEQRSIEFVTQLLEEEWETVDDPGLNVFLDRL